MNEDDTFEALRRTPIRQLQKLMDGPDFESPIYEPFSDYAISVMKTHGWTPLEFRRAWRDQALKDHPDMVINAEWWPDFIKSIE